MINDKTIYAINDGVRVREETFGLLIVSKTSPALSLNEDGKAVWNLIDGNNSVEDIINSLCLEYQSESVSQKVCILLEGMEKLGLIVALEASES